MLDHSARSVWSSTRVDSDYWHLVTDLGTESFSLHLLGIVALWLPHPCTIGSLIRFLRAASVNRTEWSRASFEILRSTIILEKRNEGKENVFFFLRWKFFFLSIFDIFFFRFDKNFGRKGKFFFRLSSILEILEKGKFLFYPFSREISKKKTKEKKFFFFSYGMKILKTYPLSAI